MKDMAKSRILTDIYKEILPHLLDTFRDSYSTSVREITQTAHLSTVSPKGARSLTCFLTAAGSQTSSWLRSATAASRFPFNFVTEGKSEHQEILTC